MNEFLLYVALPTLVAIVGVSAYYAIVEGNKGARLAEDTRTQQHPAIKPIRDAQFYMKNGHWIFGVRSEDPDLRRMTQDEMLDDAEFAAIAGLGPIRKRCHAEHATDCGV